MSRSNRQPAATVPWKKPFPGSPSDRLWNAIQVFRNLDAHMLPLYTIQVFIAIALNPGIAITELANLVRINQSSATRIVALLAEESPRHEAEQGRRETTFNYVELYVDAVDRRRTLCRLSPRGHGFYETLLALIGGGQPEEETDG